METSALRALVKAAAVGTPHARLWPNGLGFDCHGTSYTYALSPPSARPVDQWAYAWYAACEGKRGYGSTPQAAKQAAGIGGRSVNSRGGANSGTPNIVWGS